jgi:hypothetical protein
MENPFGRTWEDPEEITPEPVRELMDEVSIIGLRQYLDSLEPHKYVDTVPYKGCGDCGVGIGAYVHNSSARPESQD